MAFTPFRYFTLRNIVYAGLGVSLCASIAVGYLYWHTNNRIFQQVEQEAKQILHTSVAQIDDKFQLLKRVGDTIAHDITHGQLTNKEAIGQRIRSIAKEHPEVFGVGVAFEPYAFSKEQRLYAPYVTEAAGGNLQSQPLQESYDYSQAEWYQKTLQVGSRWMEPLYGVAAETRIVDYITPFYVDPEKTSQDNIRGVVFVDYSLQRVSDLLAQLQIGKTGYGFILSESGTLVAHPDNSFLEKEYDIFDVAQAYDSQMLKRIGHDILDQSNEYGSYEYVDPLSGKPSFLFFKKMPTTGWTLCVNFVKQEVAGSKLNTLYRYLIWLVVCLVIFAILAISWWTAIWHGKRSGLIHWSYLISLLLLAGIGSIWYLQIYIKQPQTEEGTTISSLTGLQQFLHEVPDAWPRIPTGIELSYFAFEDMNTVTLIGSLWQQFSQAAPDDVRSFFFLQGTFDEKSLQLQREAADGEEIRQWHFNANVHQDFHYDEFPFDYKYVHIPIVLQHHHNPYILTPDLAQYTVTTPSSLPGIREQLQLESWTPVMSYFSYEPVSSAHASISMGENADSQQYRLYFNFIVRRVFLYYLMSYGLPLLVGLLAIFFTLVSMFPPARVSSPPHIKETLGPLGMFISVVFVLVMIHGSLRSLMSGQPIFYLEYFYLLAYAQILAAIWVSQGVVFGSKRAFIAYNNGIIPKVLYWPVWLTGVFIVTVITFYA